MNICSVDVQCHTSTAADLTATMTKHNCNVNEKSDSCRTRKASESRHTAADVTTKRNFTCNSSLSTRYQVQATQRVVYNTELRWHICLLQGGAVLLCSVAQSITAIGCATQSNTHTGIQPLVTTVVYGLTTTTSHDEFKACDAREQQSDQEEHMTLCAADSRRMSYGTCLLVI